METLDVSGEVELSLLLQKGGFWSKLWPWSVRIFVFAVRERIILVNKGVFQDFSLSVGKCFYQVSV